LTTLGIQPAAGNYSLGDITVDGKLAFFEGLDAHGRSELWVTDGTVAGTKELHVPLADVHGGPQPYELTTLGVIKADGFGL
jgi:ELWxxDGT repeat protein